MQVSNYVTSTGDIPAKGVGFLTLYNSDFLRQGVDELISSGALTVYASGPISEGQRDGLALTHAYDMMRLSRSLKELPEGEGRLTLRPLTRPDAVTFLSIYNESVIRVLNRPTQSIADLSWLMSEEWLCGLAYLGDTPVGVYQCSKTGDTPEITALSVLEHWQGTGLGKELLARVLALLASTGASHCTARIPTNNSAFGLLRSEGFKAESLISSWYEVKILPQF